MTTTISATAQAQSLITTLEAEHGPLSFHFSGRVGGALLCLPRGELRIGGYDVLIGAYGGALVYMRTDDAEDWKDRAMLISVVQGPTRGFSLEAGSGYRFVLIAVEPPGSASG